MKQSKSIRILTFHSAYSFGAVLQSFALWKFLDERFSDVKVIDFRPDIFSLRAIISKPVTWFKTWSFRFRNKIATTKKISADDLRKRELQADIFIVGSDQVWNPQITKQYSDIYFGDFVDPKIKKISYASSFGRDKLTNEEVSNIKSHFHNFDALSVREESAIDICKDISGQSALCVVDPTFLISDYGKYFKLGKERNELCLFVLDNSSASCFDVSLEIAISKHLKPKILNKNRPVKGFMNIPMPSIPRFLNEIHTSKFVITNSFHGLAFSIIFKKQFLFVCTNKTNSTRPYNLLSKLGLTDRFMDSYEEALVASKVLPEIDYTEVNRRKDIWIKSSKDFLLSNIELV